MHTGRSLPPPPEIIDKFEFEEMPIDAVRPSGLRTEHVFRLCSRGFIFISLLGEYFILLFERSRSCHT